MSEDDTENESGVQTISKDDVELEEPSLFKVLLLNDDYTTMDFVVSVLENIFRRTPAEAVKIMLSVHNKGQGVCGVYPKQIAEAKVEAVHGRARAEGHPLKCVMEEE